MNAAAGGGGGPSDLELTPGAASAIAACHDKAASRITGLSGSVPSLDAGYGADGLADILSKVLGTADTLAMVNEVAADSVRAVGNHLSGTDGQVAAAFSELAGDPWPFGVQVPGTGPTNPFDVPLGGPR